MKFDKIIMNPPYMRDLHLKVLAKVISYLKDDDPTSVCVNLSPVGWLQDPSAEFKKSSFFNRFNDSIVKHIKDVEVISAKEGSEIFNVSFWNDLAIYTLTKDEVSHEVNLVEQLNPDIWRLVKKVGLPLYKGEFKAVIPVGKAYELDTSLPYFIKCSRVHGHPGKQDEFDCITPKIEVVFNKKGHEGREVYFNTEIEAKNFFKTMNLIFFKMLKRLACYPKTDFNLGLPYMGNAIHPRTGLKGYLSEWTDEDFYTYFNIDDEEQKIINELMASNYFYRNSYATLKMSHLPCDRLCENEK